MESLNEMHICFYFTRKKIIKTKRLQKNNRKFKGIIKKNETPEKYFKANFINVGF